MASSIPSEKELVNQATKLFQKTFGHNPEVFVQAPGRVNLIGEHTDYNDGFVLPMALPLLTVIVGRKTSSGKCFIITNSSSADEPRNISFDVPKKGSKSPKLVKPSWANYVLGVVSHFDGELCPFEAAVVSSVPLGGGLSSSASLEVATFTFLEDVTGYPALSLQQKALLCQKAEHEYADMPCGIMDQLVSVMGSNGYALLIDCRSLNTDLIPLQDPSVVVVITNSNVRHTLSGSEYPLRRQHCEESIKILGKTTFRDITLEEIEKNKDKLGDVRYKRAKHVVAEIERTSDAARALLHDDFVKFGKLMVESHESLRKFYEVSCAELDQLVKLALEVDGVYGSRMTGGGFGGCTVTLVKTTEVEKLIKHIKKHYNGEPTFYVCTPSDGAKSVDMRDK